MENIGFKGKNITLRSVDPNNPAVVAATVIHGEPDAAVIDLSGCQGPGCVLAGLTITGGSTGISCGIASPIVRNCTIGRKDSDAIEFDFGYEPSILGCTIQGRVRELDDPRLTAQWRLDEQAGIGTQDVCGILEGQHDPGLCWQGTN